ncbi:MAG: hypothetical protein HC933_12980 [Pleurocapsa sp. SU_196_0]|nr:hypothetical protein [Pleurocapsa sp. SU_196_0]
MLFFLLECTGFTARFASRQPVTYRCSIIPAERRDALDDVWHGGVVAERFGAVGGTRFLTSRGWLWC